MRQLYLPKAPRRDDPLAAMVVQENVDTLLRYVNGLRSLMYVGMVVPYPKDITGTNLVTVDEGGYWGWCNGFAQMPKADYPELSDYLGTPFSVDSTYFRLPDYSNGRGPKSKFTSYTDQDVVAEQGGNDKPTISVGQMPPHSHDVVIPLQSFDPGTDAGRLRSDTTTLGSVTFTTDTKGGGSPFDVREKYEVVGGWVILLKDPIT